MGFPGGSDSKKNPPAMQETRIRSLGRKDPLEKGQVTQVQYSCLENPHGQRSLVGYSLWGCKELDTTDQLRLSDTFLVVTVQGWGG